ncbi:MAG: tetratricopeptide repeat protein [Anaerolineae bacterium]|nr:tetratricopeptide repeat protein [Anaerolineae bacterium]
MNSLYLSHHPAASRAFALAVFRDLRARGIDARLAVDADEAAALALARSAAVLVCIVTPAAAPHLTKGGQQANEILQALEDGQPVLGLFAYGAAPGDTALRAAPEAVRAALQATPVITPPLTDEDALEAGLDYLHGQLTVLFENSAEHDSPPAANEAGSAQRLLRMAAPNHNSLLAEAWYNRALTASNTAVRLDALNHVLELNPGLAEASFQRGTLRLRAGDANGARDDFDAAAASLDSARLWLLRGQARRQTGDLAGAAEDFGRVIEHDAEQTTAWIGRGLCRRSLADLAGALSDFDAALRLGPASASLHINRGLTHKALAQGHPSNEARPYLEAARADYDAALVLEPGSAVALNNRGVVRLQLGDVPGAISDLDAALARDPAYESARRNRTAAEAALRSAAAAEDRAAAETRVSLALGLAASGLFDNALEALAEALELDPNSAAAYHARARLRAAQGDTEAALEDFTRTLELEPDSALAFADRGELYLATSQLDKAARDFSRAIRAAPDNAHYQFRRGLVRSEAGDHARAIEDFSGAIERGGPLGAAYYYRGIAHAALGEFDAAIADYNAALAFDPDMAEAYLNRGLARAAHSGSASRRAAIEDLKLYLVQSSGDDRAEVERILRKLESKR